jgi:hypothetical protein
MTSVSEKLGVLLFLGCILHFFSCGQKDPPLEVAKEGTIVVTSDPTGAHIILNGLNTGRTTPDTLSGVSVGIYTVRIELQGFLSCPESITVEVQENEKAQAEFSLVNTQHVILGEDFTSTTCEPCFPSSLVLDSLAELYSESFIVIRYHVWWPPPGNDPFYAANAEENAARNDYYDNLFAPHLFLDGSIDAGRDHNVWEAILADMANRESQVDITISNTLNGFQGSATATIISCEDLSDRNLMTRFVITESEIEFDAPNGKNIFHQVMRDMLPNPTGEPLALVPETKVQLTRDFTIDPSWNPDHLHLVVFVQDDDTREILQSASNPIR